MPNQKLKVSLYQRYGTIDIVNAFHFMNIGQPIVFPANLQAMGELFRTQLAVPIAAVQAGGLTHSRLVIGEFTPTGLVDYEYIYPQPIPGGRGNRDLIDPKTAMIWTWYSAIGGKRGRGRTYLADVGQDFGGIGMWSAGTLILMQAVIDGILGVFGNGGSDAILRMSVFSRATNGVAKPPTDESFHILVRGKCQQLFGTQRKRRPTTWV